jgi:hypothetical protein
MRAGVSVSEVIDTSLLIAQTNTALRDLRVMQNRVDGLSRECDLLRASNATLARRVVQQSQQLTAMRERCARAAAHVCDAFARLVLEDLSLRD